jgi:hypothetical protein
MVTAVQAMDDHPVAGESEELVAAVQAMDDFLGAGEKLQVPEEALECAVSEELIVGIERTPKKVNLTSASGRKGTLRCSIYHAGVPVFAAWKFYLKMIELNHDSHHSTINVVLSLKNKR